MLTVQFSHMQREADLLEIYLEKVQPPTQVTNQPLSDGSGQIIATFPAE